MRVRPILSVLMAVWMGGCAVARFDVAGASDEAAYRAAYPYYAEFCALTQIKKKMGYGADIRGEIGGHSVFYLNGVCQVPATAYPLLQVCGPEDGAGLSMNEHFSSAKWVSTPGRDFFFDGGLPVMGGVTRGQYQAVKAEARRRGIYDAVTFRPFVFETMPAGWDREDWKYEVSVGTDWGIGLARGRYCARVPVTRGQMARMVEFLNAENAPYRAGRLVFHWSVFNDNCIHLAHNALAAAGLWDVWPTGRFLPIAIFDFPVPKNEFVNVMRRTNDDWLADPGAVYADIRARGELLDYGRLPSFPGGLAEAQGPLAPNEVYDLDLKLIFYDEPTFGHYQERFDAIYREKRYFELGANRAFFRGLAARAAAGRRPLEWWLGRAPYRDDVAGFSAVYAAYYRAVAGLED
jgi:hypothetical protein